VDWQFQNFYGHPYARLDRSHSYEIEVEPEDEQNDDKNTANNPPDAVSVASVSWTMVEFETPQDLMTRLKQMFIGVLLRVCCVVLFDSPAAHNDELEEVWVDKIVNKYRFNDLVVKVMEDWKNVSLQSTVLLA
jgi:hypothetical protein